MMKFGRDWYVVFFIYFLGVFVCECLNYVMWFFFCLFCCDLLKLKWWIELVVIVWFVVFVLNGMFDCMCYLGGCLFVCVLDFLIGRKWVFVWNLWFLFWGFLLFFILLFCWFLMYWNCYVIWVMVIIFWIFMELYGKIWLVSCVYLV